MRSIIKSSSIQNNFQALKCSIDIRKVANNKYRQSASSDYLRSSHDQFVSRKKKDIDVDEYTGATSRRSLFKQYYQDQPSLGFVYHINPGRGMQFEPDCSFSVNDFLGKLTAPMNETLVKAYEDLDRVVKIQVNQNKPQIRQNLEQIFRDKNPNKEFDFDREYARFLKLDSKKLKKEYGFESD